MTDEKDKIGFALNRITTEQFAIIESSYFEGKRIDLKTGLRFGIDFDNESISVFFSANLIQEKSPFLIIETSCHFNIRKENWYSFQTQNKMEFIVPKGFMSHLVMLTIGTTRGVLHSKKESTSFNRFSLPTLNVKEMLKQDVVFKVESEKRE